MRETLTDDKDRPQMRRHFALVLTLNAVLAACSDFPQLDDTVSNSAHDAAYPDLVPVEGIQNRLPDTQIDATTSTEVEARVARLKARAARLKGAVLDSTTRQRMEAGVQ